MNWTKKRIKQLELLRQLLIEVKTIDRGSGVLNRIKLCENLASELFDTDINRTEDSFYYFLESLVREERKSTPQSPLQEPK